MFRSGDISGALDCYQRATAQYKLAGEWDKAAEVLSKMGDILKKKGEEKMKGFDQFDKFYPDQEILVLQAGCMGRQAVATGSFQLVLLFLLI